MAFLKITLFISVILFISITCHGKQEEVIYYCPMHPDYTSAKPGYCPICNMELVKKEKEVKLEPNVKNTLFLSEEESRTIGLRLVTVERRNFTFTLRLPGQVAYDPQLYSALVEYRQVALGLSSAEDKDIFLKPLALKLKQLGLSQVEFAKLKRGLLDPTLYLLGSKGGYAIVYLQVYESDIGLLQVATKVIIRAKAYPLVTFSGKILGFSEIVNLPIRTFTLRVQVKDPTHLLKPQMLVEGEIATKPNSLLAIPADALLDTGKRKIVFIASDNFHLRAQEVITGIESDGWVEILQGLQEKQQVAAGATFLLDSERRLSFHEGH